jgi:hypothetical protein
MGMRLRTDQTHKGSYFPFVGRRELAKDDEKGGRPKWTRTAVNIAAVADLVNNHRRIFMFTNQSFVWECHLDRYQSNLSKRFYNSCRRFRILNIIPPCFSIDLVLNFLLSWLLVLLPSAFFLDVLFFFSPLVSIP